ncbi:MAG: helix-turn-helix domain-containing protein [candidate division KSB1 bacterium]|nr:helix-turn-helix domain-containing protein [candidate division KSB1 bacterium]MDZ7303221.1 helix-turn-helix domain-containing protein [candidate division KSB1 bacterium]MDZ7312167.1 helix-turn-helix domain-containing protein [candidate division KSB1 bacterium]
MPKTFGQALRDIRRAKNLSQRELAQKTGVDFSYISKIENDRLPPPAADTIVKICEILDVPPEQLLALTGKVPSEVTETIGTSAAAIQFIRDAQAMKLTEEEWQRLGRQLRRLRR